MHQCSYESVVLLLFALPFAREMCVRVGLQGRTGLESGFSATLLICVHGAKRTRRKVGPSFCNVTYREIKNIKLNDMSLDEITWHI